MLESKLAHFMVLLQLWTLALSSNDSSCVDNYLDLATTVKIMLIFIVYVRTVRRWYLKCDYPTTSLCAMSSVKCLTLSWQFSWGDCITILHTTKWPMHSQRKYVDRIEPSTTGPVQCIRKQTNTWYSIINSGCIWALRAPLYHRVHKHHNRVRQIGCLPRFRKCLYHFISEHYIQQSIQEGDHCGPGVRWSLKLCAVYPLHGHWCSRFKAIDNAVMDSAH